MAAAKIALIVDNIVNAKNFFDCLQVNQDIFLVSEICLLELETCEIFASLDYDAYPWKLAMTKDMETVLNNSDFVICQLRGADEEKSLRFIEYLCRKIEQFCPDALLINYSNHLGVLSQFIQDNFSIKSVGISDAPQTFLRLVKDYFGEDATMEYIGTSNHGFVTSIKDGGGMEHKDKLLFPKKNSEQYIIKQGQQGFDALEDIGALPSEYLTQIVRMEEAKSLGYQCNSKDEKSLSQTIEHQNIVIEIMDAIYNQHPCVHIVNTPNNGALKFMRDSDVVEIAAHIGREGIIPMSVEFFDNHYIIEYMLSHKKNEQNRIENIITSR